MEPPQAVVSGLENGGAIGGGNVAVGDQRVQLVAALRQVGEKSEFFFI